MPRLAEICARALEARARDDARIHVLDGDLGDSYGVDRFARACGAQFINGGIAEQNLLSVAAGMAACGDLPWVFSFAAFLCYRAYDQIRVCVSQTAMPVVLVGSHAGALGGKNGKTHVTLNDLALMCSLPCLSVYTPADRADVERLVRELVENPVPAYVRMPREECAELPGEAADVRWVTPPAPLALIAYGLSTHWALEVYDALARAGVACGVVHVARLKPLDSNALVRVLDGVEQLVAIEDHYAIGGLGATLRAIPGAPPVRSFAWPEHWSGQSGEADELRRMHGLDAATIARGVREAAVPCAL